MKKFVLYLITSLYILSNIFTSGLSVYAEPEEEDTKKVVTTDVATESSGEEAEKDSGLDEDYEPRAQHMLVCDVESGYEVYAKDSTKSINPYSFTKIVTAITAIENTPDINKKTTVPNGVLKDFDYDYNNVGIASGETISIKALLSAMLMGDAGDCAIALAHAVGKDYNNFIKLMNDTATKAGAEKSVFTEPVGFNDSKNKTTLKDMAKITSYALKNETFKEFVAMHYMELPATNKRGGGRYIHNRNYFMSKFYSTDYYDDRIRGIQIYNKDETDTGLIIRYSSGNDNLLILTAKSHVADKTNYAYEDTLHLIQKGKNFFTRVRLVKKEEFVSEIKLKSSKNTDRVLAISTNEIVARLPEEYKSSLITREIELKDDIDAPLEKYEELGTITVKYDGLTVGTSTIASYSKIEKSIFNLIKNFIVDFICSIYFLVLILMIVVIKFIKTKIKKSKRKK